MDKLFDPQIIFIYNAQGNIKKTIFLTYNKENLLKSKQYQIYEYYKNNINIFITDEYEIIQNHILLTLTIGEIKAYIRHQILKTDLKILLFSLWNNIDYINKNESIFNPFDLENQVYEKIPETTLIYKIYNQVAFISIFCVLDEDSISPDLCSEGFYKEEIFNFIDPIMKYHNDNLENLEISIEKKDKIIYNINTQKYLFYDIQNLKFVNKTINEYHNYYSYISGNVLKILKPQENLFDINISIFNDEKEILFINNDILSILDIEEYNKILLMFPGLENIIIKQKVTKQSIKIDYNISLGILVLDYDIDFFIDETKKTKNIFLDRSKSINIITSNNHTYFSTYQTPQINLYVYIIKIIIGIQLLRNKINFLLIDKKKGNRYFSRYCQGIRNPEQIDINTINKDDFIIHENIYYENKKNAGDVFFHNKTQQYVQCKHKNIHNIGFIKELYQGYNICYPCCYKKKKNDNEIFKNCIFNLNIKEKIAYDPYIRIFKQYRVIVDNFKLSLLLDKINILFNSSNIIYNERPQNLDKYIYINKYNKIEEAKNYIIYTTNKDNIDFKDIKSIKENYSPCMFFLNNEIYYNQDIIPDYYKDPDTFLKNFKFYLIIQNKLHIIQTINKKYNDSDIIVSDIDINIKKRIIDKYFFPIFTNYTEDKQVSTKYLYKANNISLYPNTLGFYIVNVLYIKYFDTIFSIDNEDILLYKITFLINLLNISKIDINFNINFNLNSNTKNIILNLLKYLNEDFVEKKEIKLLNEYSRRI
jgi:hypothetical protein